MRRESTSELIEASKTERSDTKRTVTASERINADFERFAEEVSKVEKTRLGDVAQTITEIKADLGEQGHQMVESRLEDQKNAQETLQEGNTESEEINDDVRVQREAANRIRAMRDAGKVASTKGIERTLAGTERTISSEINKGDSALSEAQKSQQDTERRSDAAQRRFG